MIVYGTLSVQLPPAWRGVAPMVDYYRVKSPFMIYPGGQVRILRAGAVVSSDDPAYKGHEAAFEPLENSVERATAAPGEVRHVVIPQPEPDLDDMTKDELLAEADRRGVDVPASATKAEVRKALEG